MAVDITIKEKRMDISILRKAPKIDSSNVLEIQPLAPLSMVNELPGTYFKTLKMPDKKMLCGLFENILGWHIDIADRKQIFKDLVDIRKKQAKQGIASKQIDYTKGSTYVPLLIDYFEIQNITPDFTRVVFFDDLWSRAFQRKDAVVHPKGTFNISYEMIVCKNSLRNESQQLEDKDLEKLFKENMGCFPLYYSTPTTREYISMSGKYIIQLMVDSVLMKMLQEKTTTDNIGYLGANEGWVDLKFIEL
jgi:CRISPR-associated protein Cas5